MRTVTLSILVALSLVGSVAPVAAQGRYGIRAHTDWAVSYAPGEVTFAGWAFNCDTEGQQPFAVRVRYVDAYKQLVEVPVTVRASGLKRPDVAKAFGYCGTLSKFTGFQFTVTDVPPGVQHLTVEWYDSLSVHYSQLTVAVQ